MIVNIITEVKGKRADYTFEELAQKDWIGLECIDTDDLKYFYSPTQYSNHVFMNIGRYLFMLSNKAVLLRHTFNSPKFITFRVFETDKELYKWMSE